MKNAITEEQAANVLKAAGRKVTLEYLDAYLNQAEDSGQPARFINVWTHQGHEDEIKQLLRAAGVELAESELDDLTPENDYASAAEHGTKDPYFFEAWDGGTCYGLKLVKQQERATNN